MITIIYSTHKDQDYNNKFRQHLLQTVGLKNVEVLEYQNNNEYSLTEVYNRGLKESQTDIVVFCHNDIIFETKNWGKKLLKLFEKNPEYGILGVAGSRELPSSGMWWENPNHMYGQVFHQHNGKKWLSKYSEKKPNFIDNVVIVDGLFISVDKSKIKKDFDESVKGFHFYDVDFCFRNYVEGVKVGVMSDIDITHLSIGQTNQEWEDNRKSFSEKYQNILPIKSEKYFNKNNKMKVLIGCLNFKSYTGSELYVYELAKELINQNCEVDIISNLGDKLVNKIKKFGVNCYSLGEPRGFKVGDGKWELNTGYGMVKSNPGTLYKMSDVKYDIININHKPIGEHLIKLYPNSTFINTIHSEVIPGFEDPVIDNKVKKYITIRESIKHHLIKGWNIPENNISVIYNPIDSNRFKPYTSHPKNSVLFVGTIDYLRKNTIYDLVGYAINNNKELWLVGENKLNYLDDLLLNDCVKYFPSTWNVEDYIKECQETASVMMGRTTIEGWLCGKEGWIYNIDKDGNIIDKELHSVPNNLDRYKSNVVTKQIIEEFKSVI
jgi:GT2 family glycosyltransferase